MLIWHFPKETIPFLISFIYPGFFHIPSPHSHGSVDSVHVSRQRNSGRSQSVVPAGRKSNRTGELFEQHAFLALFVCCHDSLEVCFFDPIHLNCLWDFHQVLSMLFLCRKCFFLPYLSYSLSCALMRDARML